MKLSRGILIQFAVTGIVVPFLAGTALARESAPSSQVSVVERGQHFKVVEAVQANTNAVGKSLLQTNRYTELQNGLHWQDAAGQWIESQPVVQVYEKAIICTGATYSVILNRNLNSSGDYDVQTSDQKRIISHPLSLSFFDPETGRSVLLAQVKDCQAEVVSSNQIVFRDAFEGSGIKAAVTYTYAVGHFHQDVTFVKRPAVTPAQFGLGSRTRLEVFTEILESPIPNSTARLLKQETNPLERARMVEPDLVDETIG